MLASWHWLREYVAVGEGDVDAVAKKLTSAGIQVEGVKRLGEDFSGVVVAEVRAKRAHPKVERLTLVTVADGAGTHEVVCGASNVPAPGGKVLWARPGARLPGGREIGAKDLQGVRSAGMICSETELGIGEDGGGIVVLSGEDAAAAPGTAAQDALGLRDVQIDLNVTTNRPDCLGHFGVAREIAALTGAKLTRPDVAIDKLLGGADVGVGVTIDDAKGCPRYVARVIDGLRVGPSPRWMRRRLEAVGVRPISNLVDVTNYVMFELGQPLHAFDLAKVAGPKIVVRRAKAGEKMTTLDGQERALVVEDLLICDASGPVALAGVMGGGGSEVSDGTTLVLLESAYFDPRTVRRTAKRLGLHSESSHRFERGVDPNGADLASLRAAKLLAELGRGTIARGSVDVYPTKIAPLTIDLRPARANALLGLALPADEMARVLRALELSVDSVDAAKIRVTAPTFRPDLEREVDLIEEIGRVHLDAIPATLPRTTAAPQGSGDRLVEAVRDALVAAGLHEAITFGFTSPARIAALRFPDGHTVMRPIPVRNPLREDHTVMRTSLMPNLLAALAHNLKFGVTDVRLFEVGHVFLQSGKQLPDEPRYLAGVMCGERAGWLKPAGPLDFFDTKGVIERLFAALRMNVEFVPARNEDGFLHPGAGAAILIGGEHVGVVGELHPATRDRAGIERPAFGFEVALDRLPPLGHAQATAVDRFPAIGRDVSFFVDDFVNASRIRGILLDRKPPFLESVAVLDDYREPGKVPPGKKGMLWSITYRAADRTLTDAEVDAAHEAIVKRLLETLGAERR